MTPFQPTGNRITMTYDGWGRSSTTPFIPVSYPVNIIYDSPSHRPKQVKKAQEDDKGHVIPFLPSSNRVTITYDGSGLRSAKLAMPESNRVTIIYDSPLHKPKSSEAD